MAFGANSWPLWRTAHERSQPENRGEPDDTTVPVLAKGKCRTGRLWTYVCDDRPFAGTAAPAAAFFYSADRGAVHPDAHLATYSGLSKAPIATEAVERIDVLFVPCHGMQVLISPKVHQRRQPRHRLGHPRRRHIRIRSTQRGGKPQPAIFLGHRVTRCRLVPTSMQLGPSPTAVIIQNRLDHLVDLIR
jgi:Transposase IS66 family